MRQQPQRDGPHTLDYRRTRAGGEGGTTRFVRIVGALGSVFFLVIGAYSWWTVDRGNLQITTFFQPYTLMSLAGAVFCLLVTLGIVPVRNG